MTVRRAGDLPHRYGTSTRKPQSPNSQNGSATWISQVSTDRSWPIGLRGGLIRLLALIVGVALLFTARHPTGWFTLIDDTADYPPLRLDTRGGESPPAPPAAADNGARSSQPVHR
jgi:hypothetical protein